MSLPMSLPMLSRRLPLAPLCPTPPHTTPPWRQGLGRRSVRWRPHVTKKEFLNYPTDRDIKGLNKSLIRSDDTQAVLDSLKELNEGRLCFKGSEIQVALKMINEEMEITHFIDYPLIREI